MFDREDRPDDGVVAFTAGNSIKGHSIEFIGWMLLNEKTFRLGAFRVDGGFKRVDAPAEVRQEIFIYLCTLMVALEEECRHAGVPSIQLSPYDDRAASLWARFGFMRNQDGSMTYEVAND